MPGPNSDSRFLARVTSPVEYGPTSAAKGAWVPVSTSDTNRICGWDDVPREAPGYPNASALAGESTTSSVVPSTATVRQERYQVPRVFASDIGRASLWNSKRIGSIP